MDRAEIDKKINDLTVSEMVEICCRSEPLVAKYKSEGRQAPYTDATWDMYRIFFKEQESKEIRGMVPRKNFGTPNIPRKKYEKVKSWKAKNREKLTLQKARWYQRQKAKKSQIEHG